MLQLRYRPVECLDQHGKVPTVVQYTQGNDLISWAQHDELSELEDVPMADRIAHDQDIRLGAAERYSR